MELSNSSVIRHSPEVLFKEVTGEMVLLDLTREQYFGLDQVGTRVWELIDNVGQFDSIVEAIVAEYDVANEVARNDLKAMLTQLEKEGLVKIS